MSYTLITRNLDERGDFYNTSTEQVFESVLECKEELKNWVANHPYEIVDNETDEVVETNIKK